jgi:hypothetical protein
VNMMTAVPELLENPHAEGAHFFMSRSKPRHVDSSMR